MGKSMIEELNELIAKKPYETLFVIFLTDNDFQYSRFFNESGNICIFDIFGIGIAIFKDDQFYTFIEE